MSISNQILSNQNVTKPQQTGAIITATHNTIQGFAKDNSAPDNRVTLEIFIDDEFYFKFYVNNKNASPGKEHLFFPHNDFHIHCDLPLRPLKLSIRFTESGIDIENSPIYLNYDGKPVTISIENDSKYLEETYSWLDKRFSEVYKDGIYFAHQPIYGYRSNYSEPNLLDRYLITFHIMNVLAGLSFKTFLDVGGAEGYKAAMVANFFGAQVTSSDISQQACNRAYELYGIKTVRSDMHSLPFEDEQFDVVLCSESIEHVPDFKRSLEEVLRICKKAAIITVPHESQIQVKTTIEHGQIHGHIQYFDVYSFEYLNQLGYNLFIQKMLLQDPKILIPGILMECHPDVIDAIKNKQLKWLAKYFPWLMRLIFNKSVVAPILEQDMILGQKGTDVSYRGILALIVKDDQCISAFPNRMIRMREVMDFTVPFLRKRMVNDE